MAQPNQKYLDPTLAPGTANVTDKGRIVPIIYIDPATNLPVGGASPEVLKLISSKDIMPIVIINKTTGEVI